MAGVTFALVPDAAWPGSDQWLWSTAPATGPVGRLGRPSVSDPWGVGSFLSLVRPTCVRCPGPLGSCSGVPARCVVLCVRCPGPPGSCSPVCPLGVLCCVCGVLGHLAPVHRCARAVCCVACAVSWATWLLFTGVPARCVVLHVRCPGPPGSCSPVCPLGVLCCMCGVLGLLAPVHRCARSVGCVACAVSWATWLPFTGVPARCVVLRVRCPGPPGFRSPVCPLGVLCCVCGVLGHLAPVHRCAGAVCCFACAVSWATWLLFTGVPARCVVLRVRCPGPLGSCSPVCRRGVLFRVCGVLGHLAPVHRCAGAVCCFACAVSWATWLLFTGVPARCVVSRVRCPGPLGSCSPVCPLRVFCCPYGVLGLLAPVHRCAGAVCCFACAVSWATWLLFTGVPASCVLLGVRCPGPLGSCSPVCPLPVFCCPYGVLGLLAPVHRCARAVCCFACAVSWATWLLFTVVPASCVLLRVRCPGPPGSCSPVCPLGGLCCVCGVLGHLAPVHRCARSVCFFARAVSWASWLLFTGVPARCVVLRVPCPGPLGSCSPVCPLGVLFCVCGVLGLLAPVHGCAHSVCCVACAVSWATWLLFTGVPARCVVLHVRCPGPPGSCSPVCPLGVLFRVCGVLGLLAPVHRCARAVLLCCVCGVLGLLAPVHRCARSLCCFACAVSWASWLLFTGVPARCVVLRVRCPGPLGSCSPVCPLGVLFCMCGVLGLLAPVLRCARSVCCVGCAVSWATWLLFTGVPARCVVLRVRCPGSVGSCSPVCPLGVLCWVCGVLGHLAPVHRCARSVCCVARAVSWASWLLFTGVFALCAVLRVARGVLLCGASLRGAHSSIRTAAVRSRQGLGTLRARTRPSGRRLFLAGRGWVPSGRALVHPDGGCSVAGRGWVPSGRALVHPDGCWCACVCVCVLCLAGSGGPASRARSGVLAALSFCFAWPPPGWGCPPLSRCCCRPSLPWRCVLVVFLGLPLPGSPCARASFVSPAWPLAALWWLLPPPLFFCVSRFSSLLLGALVFFFFSSSSVRPRCLRLSLVSGPGCPGPRRCALIALLAFRFSALRALVPLSCFPPGCWLLPGGCCPPPPFVSRGFCRCRLVLCAVCCVVLCVPGCAAAPRCCALCRPVLCCRVLCCARLVPLLVAPCPLALPVALGPCALRRCVLRCSPALCALCCVCFVVARWCVLFFAALLCAVCVPGCCAVRSLSSPLCAVLCFVVLVRSRCAVRVVRAVAGAWCCGALLCVVQFPVVCRGAVLGLVARGCLLVACFGVGVPVWPRGLLSCGWCGLLWCPAFLCRVLWCCAVVGASCCGVSLCVVVSPLAFCSVVVLLWCGVLSCCAVRCPVVSCALCRVLRCRAALRCCAGWLCCAVVCAAGVCFSFCPLFLC